MDYNNTVAYIIQNNNQPPICIAPQNETDHLTFISLSSDKLDKHIKSNLESLFTQYFEETNGELVLALEKLNNFVSQNDPTVNNNGFGMVTRVKSYR
ncbi:hypothetical protein [Bacillus gaemokensis]|uniref:Uncharacterized protein n=1 Tax=Bacillus gaemokensis TaxID=574375 RepID=A0A073KFI3_9BACI|nr:hypothetical protein [Bacillus gaemokensis]KEK25207.1 hypothetical protein BAGA_11270 [Bacillus gaemokensis]KYG37350.1 hypothetical protein AZF08_08065 [Bacillus gaemokensis]